MNYTRNTSTSRTTLSRVGLRGLLIVTGVMALLISSLSGSASFNTAVAPFKPASADLSQVRNGGVGCDQTVPNSCNDPADWVNGNAGASNPGPRSSPTARDRRSLPPGE
jgi:hypothetical protein